jgi:hypothetical protein
MKIVVAAIVIGGLCIFAMGVLSRAISVPRLVLASSKEKPETRNLPPEDSAKSKRPEAKYVGSNACFVCHSDISKKFSLTDMGRSMDTATPELLDTLRLPGHVDDPKQDRHFEVFLRDGKLYQSEWQTGSDGSEVFRDTREVEWIVGAGANGFGGIVRREGYLFQGPLSYYSKAAKWDLSPGYEFGDYGFNRPILAGCIGCHSGRPRPVPATNGRYEEPAFSQLAIGCENCHGPGSAHVAAMREGKELPGSAHHAIVNPAALAPGLANDICMSCHQTGDLRVFQPGKTYADFRPGEPLDKTLSILMVPPKPESPPDADHLQHYYSMTLSKCYRATAGRLTCITCHDPHIEPSRDSAPAYFAAKCLTCHTRKSCTAPLESRLKTNPSDDCIGCHMPKRDVRTIQHASITNHRILSRPGEPFPAEAFQQTTPALPDLVHLDPAPGASNVPPPALTLLEAYGELLDQHPDYTDRYFQTLGQLEQSSPNDTLVQSALGRRDLRAAKYESAIEHLQRAIAIGPPQATTYGDLGDALVKLDRPEEALSAQQKAVALDPFNPQLQKAEIVSYVNLKQYANAKAALTHYLEVFPQDSFMRHMLEMASAGAHPQ